MYFTPRILNKFCFVGNWSKTPFPAIWDKKSWSDQTLLKIWHFLIKKRLSQSLVANLSAIFSNLDFSNELYFTKIGQKRRFPTSFQQKKLVGSSQLSSSERHNIVPSVKQVPRITAVWRARLVAITPGWSEFTVILTPSSCRFT
ncbi:hypothetical protein Hanom_Chr06g00481391 [Helianthus anomalus]